MAAEINPQFSTIDSTKPVSGTPTTQSVRDNFEKARLELDYLHQKALNLKTTHEFYPVINNLNPNVCPYCATTDNSTESSLQANNITFIPFLAPQNMAFTKLSINVTTTYTGLVQVAIYDNILSNGSNKPNDKLREITDIEPEIPGVKVGNFASLSLIKSDLYWLAISASANVPISHIEKYSIIPILGAHPNLESFITAITYAQVGQFPSNASNLATSLWSEAVPLITISP